VRVYLDSPHPRNVPPTWNGDARGHFESDDTFVVDTVGFNARSWLNSDRWVHSEELRVVERYRLYGDGQYIQLRVFVDDRLALKEPYTYTRYYRKVAEPTEGGESVCNENAPEDDLWAQRRDKLLDEHNEKFAALMAKYANEPLPGRTSTPASSIASVGGADLSRPRAGAPVRGADLPVSPKPGEAGAGPRAGDAAKLRALAGIYEPVPVGMTLPGGLKPSGTPNDMSLVSAAQATAKSRNLEFDPAKHCMVVGPFRMMARDDNRFELLTTGTPPHDDVRADRPRQQTRNLPGAQRTHHQGRPDVPRRFHRPFRRRHPRRRDDAVQRRHLAQRPRRAAQRCVASRGTAPPRRGGRFLEYQVTAEDPKVLAKPYSYTRYYQRSTDELQEDFCEDRR
jgi:hypothetical protein